MIYCFVYRLQLALVAASREVCSLHQFFSNLSFIINTICSSTKRFNELRLCRVVELQEVGREGNQSYTLKRAGDTRKGSHCFSVCSLIEMFHPTSSVSLHMTEHGNNYHIRGDVDGAYNFMTSFEFVFILHLMKETLGITDSCHSRGAGINNIYKPKFRLLP